MSGGLVVAVNSVMLDVGYIQGTGKNTQQGYSYTSDEDLLRALQPAMAKHGLMLAPVEMEWNHEEIATRSGSSQCRVNLTATYELRHADGESLRVVACGQGTDSLDKAIYKAQTGAYKYAVRAVFAVPTGDDAERDHQRPRQATSPQPAKAGFTKAQPAKSDRPARLTHEVVPFERPSPAAAGEPPTVVGGEQPPAPLADDDIPWDADPAPPPASGNAHDDESFALLCKAAIRDNDAEALPALLARLNALPNKYHQAGATHHYWLARVTIQGVEGLDAPKLRMARAHVAAVKDCPEKAKALSLIDQAVDTMKAEREAK